VKGILKKQCKAGNKMSFVKEKKEEGDNTIMEY